MVNLYFPLPGGQADVPNHPLWCKWRIFLPFATRDVAAEPDLHPCADELSSLKPRITVYRRQTAKAQSLTKIILLKGKIAKKRVAPSSAAS